MAAPHGRRLRPVFVGCVLARDWPRLVSDHLNIRYAAHAPDHPRNLAFAARWKPPAGQ